MNKYNTPTLNKYNTPIMNRYNTPTLNKYDAPDVVYRGYIVPTAQFTEIMVQIPSYKDVMDHAGYGDANHIWSYAHWKKLVLEEKLRKQAPRIKPYDNRALVRRRLSLRGTHPYYDPHGLRLRRTTRAH
ncbi:hypothetical protein FA13DRAFT_791003 [Coprinellus micaceus]|uniref:Uncharacterized protein n=1 Tax=Coprinellus micaceus TaxID=71717 RepID=A0A4Y7T2Q6_COPMI|nr:hypothetical protein FA13DRAFT_791003 [Coprinellus micaceus]